MAKSLSERVHSWNKRKVEVNAQVTAVITALEVLGNLVNSVIWMFIIGFTGFSTLGLNMLLYFILLPCIFLMNTKHNKNRIVEKGWKNVIRNAFGFPKESSLDESDPIQGTNISDNKSESNLSRIRKWFKTRRHVVRPFVASFQPASQKIEIFTISQNQQFPLYNTVTDESSPAVDINKAANSGKRTVKNGAENFNEGSHGPQNRLYRISMGSKIISLMSENMQDEMLYIRYFRKLLAFEETLKQDNHSHPFGVKRVDTRDARGSSSNCSANQDEEFLNLNNDEESYETSDVQNNFTGEFQDRVAMRKQMLSAIQHCDDDEDRYEEFLERLINMEEDLIS